MEHGTWRAYRKGCHCDDCRLAWNKYKRDLRASKPKKERKKREPGPIKHGTFYSYQGRGCRCEECREFIAMHARIRRGGTLPKLATPRFGVSRSTNNLTRDGLGEAT